MVSLCTAVLCTHSTHCVSLDSEYVQDLLLCYPTFATPHDLLNIIIEKYSSEAVSAHSRVDHRYTSTALESFTVTGKDFESAAKKQQLTGIR
jgi:hypothetical protein